MREEVGGRVGKEVKSRNRIARMLLKVPLRVD